MSDKEKSDMIETVLNQVLSESKDHEDFEEGDFIADWAVIVYTANPDEEKGNSYRMFYSNGLIPHYRAIGLHEVALNSLKQDGLID